MPEPVLLSPPSPQNGLRLKPARWQNADMRRHGWTLWTVLLVILTSQATATAQDWKPMFDGQTLSGWTSTRFGGGGEIEVSDGAIVLNMGMLTGVNYTNPTPTVDYEIELEARRTVGSDFFCGLTFPVQSDFATLIVGGWGGSVVGISSLDGEDAAHNETTAYQRFDAGRWYRIRLSVWIDAERKINADIRGKKISLRAGDIELSKPLGIASYSTTAELRGIRMRALGGNPAGAKAGGKTNVLVLPDAAVSGLDHLVAAATNSPVASRRLAQLCDTFGPRFSGSTNLEAAIDWMLREMRTDGLDNVHGEPVTVPRWHRGSESVELLAPVTGRLPMLGLGGSVGTPPGGITAPVLVVTNYAELEQRATEARGRIVVFNAPFTEYGDTVRFRSTGAIEAAKAGAVASLIRSVTPFSLQTPHTGSMRYDPAVPAIPHAALTPEDAGRLARWQAAGTTPVIKLVMEAQTLSSTESRNVIAEVRGREHPEQVVVVGGHVDSWDVGQGAQDDGGGCLAAWEAVRLIKQRTTPPRRTVRLVLWTNEENGLAGGKAYRDAHREELANHVAAIEADSGTFAPAGFGFTGSESAWPWVRGVSSYLGERLDAGDIKAGGGDADLTPLLEQGVPCFGLRMKPNHYFWFHHTAADTVDKVAPADLQRCTAALAVLTLALADSDAPLPR